MDYTLEHIKKLAPHLSECTLFLKRDSSFPLTQPGTIAAYGNGIRHTVKGGTGSGDVYSKYFITIEEGLKNSGFTIATDKWLDKYDELLKKSRKTWIKSIKKEAKREKVLAPVYAMGAVMPIPEYDLPLDFECESAIYVVTRISGEGSDRKLVSGDVKLTNSEIRDILELNNRYEKFMLVINAGGYIDLSPVLEVRNILVLSELGVEIGQCLADILLGKANPSGKLSATWAKVEDYPYPMEFDKNDTKYIEGRYVGYRYFDTFKVKPLFPFGFGLSYSSFELSNYQVSNYRDGFTVKVDVTNTSEFIGKEVVELYVSSPNDDIYQSLVGFNKTTALNPNEKVTLNIYFELNQLARFDTNRALYYLEKGTYVLRMGNSSDNTIPICNIVLDEEVILKRTNLLFKENDNAAILSHEVLKEKNYKVPTINLSKKDITIHHYKKKEIVIPEEIEKLTNKQLALLGCGRYSRGLSSIVGGAGVNVPGAAGQTSLVLKELTDKDIVMADGPAGLRIAPQYIIKRNKPVSIGKNQVALDVIDFLPSFLAFFAKKTFLKEKKVRNEKKIHYQYTTALPIGTAIAQSWNKQFAFVCGDIVGEEMERFNVDLWLAPALNIHRHILCGRNFEYYSEDPYLSGTFASMLTKGVESHKGKGVTIKHYVGNNQETNRYTSNSIIDERTLREIYLRGFEICINDAHPKAIMSSYNLVNGIHTSESRRLIDGFIYQENGYEGIVMTDWVVRTMESKNNKYRYPITSKVISSSHTLFMPGSKKDMEELLEALNKNKALQMTLKESATRLYILAKEMKGE